MAGDPRALAEKPAPKLSLDRMVGPNRTLALVRTTLEAVKRSRTATGTVNDVLLAATAGGLRSSAAVANRSRTPRCGSTSPSRCACAAGCAGRNGQPDRADGVPLPLGRSEPGAGSERIAAETAKRKAKARTSLGTLFGGRIVQAAAPGGRHAPAGERDHGRHPGSRVRSTWPGRGCRCSRCCR